MFLNHAGKNVHAIGIKLPENKFLVLRGARVNQISNLMNQQGERWVEELRQRLISDGTIVNCVFTTDYEFTSPSTATTVVLGSASSGNDKWKYADGVKLGERRI